MRQYKANFSDLVCHHITTAQYGHLSATTRRHSARALMDGVGVMLAASAMSSDIKPFIDMSIGGHERAAEGAKQGICKILGLDQFASVTNCALANGAMAHALDFEDAFDGAPCHPNAALLAALLAVVQTVPNVTGGQFLNAMAVGCDLVCRLGLSLRRPMEAGGWYPPPILGAIGAAAAVSNLLGLDALQTRSALSIILCQTVMPGEIKYSHGTNLRAVREAFGAQAAVQSCLLARGGVVGFETPFEGEGGFYRLYADGQYDAKDVLGGLGEKYYIDDLTFKAWPACRGTHAYIELALQWLSEFKLDWREIDRIHLTTSDIHEMLLEPHDSKIKPRHAIDAKFSLPFCIATALVRGRVGLDDFSDNALVDTNILAVAAKITAIKSTSKCGQMISPFGGEMKIVLKTGQSWSGFKQPALGHPDVPLSDDQIRAKFIDCAARAKIVGTQGAAIQLAHTLSNIENVTDMGALVRTI